MGKRARRIRQLRKLGVEPPPPRKTVEMTLLIFREEET